MKSLFKALSMLRLMPWLAAIVLAASFLLPVASVPVQAATTNYPPSVPVYVVPFHISGQYTATATGIVKFNFPFKAQVVSVQANARASGGTSPTLTVDVMTAGVSLLSTPVAITAGTVAEATLATATTIADEDAVTVNFAIGGTSPTWNDITVVLTVVRL